MRRLEEGFHLQGILTPKMRGRVKDYLATLHVKVYGFLRLPQDHQGVQAGVLHLGAEEPPGLRIPIPSGEGAFGGHGVAARPRDGGAGEDAGGKDKGVFRAQGIRSLGHMLQKEVSGKGPTPKQASPERLAVALIPDPSRGEVHEGHAVVIALGHS